jgi:hypothetical protein
VVDLRACRKLDGRTVVKAGYVTSGFGAAGGNYVLGRNMVIRGYFRLRAAGMFGMLESVIESGTSPFKVRATSENKNAARRY